MNKYKVNRVITKGDFTTTSQDYIVFAKSAEQAISQTRYSLTRTDKMPNGEPTDYVDDDGFHITWRAEVISQAPELDPDDLESLDEIMKTAQSDAVSSTDIAKRYMELHPDGYKDISSARRVVNATIAEHEFKPANNQKRNRLFAEADANKIIKIMEEGNTTGKHKKKPALWSWSLVSEPKNEPEPVEPEFCEETESRLADMMKVLEVTRERLIVKALENYLDEIYDMTVNELFTLKEALHGN